MKYLLPSITACLLLLACAKEQKNSNPKTVTDTIITTKVSKTSINTQKEVALKNSITNPKFNPESLYGIWTVDNNGPHADFELTEKSFYVVDYDGDGDMPYTLNHDTLTIMYTDYNSIGIIKKVVKDTMVINWNNGTDVTYVTWKG